MINTIDDFLGTAEPCASFHDARLISVQINYDQRELVSNWSLYVGDPESERERTRPGRLSFSGLLFWVVEPYGQVLDGSRPWLTSYGSLLEAGTDLAKELSERVPQGASAWYLYFSDWNVFAYCCAENGTFAWVE